MPRTVISTSNAPGAVGAYSQAIATDALVFCSGQVGIDPETGTLVGGSIAEETRRCMQNLNAVLDAAGSSMPNVVKFTVYLTDIGDFEEFNGAFAEFVGPEPPARATVGVAALPKGARVEIECIALL